MVVNNVDDLAWRTSSRSNGGGGNCVEVADLADGGRVVRDTKDHGQGPVLRFTAREWVAFVEGVKLGEFD